VLDSRALESLSQGLDPRSLQTLLIESKVESNFIQIGSLSESGLKSPISRQIFGLPAKVAIFLAKLFGWAAAGVGVLHPCTLYIKEPPRAAFFLQKQPNFLDLFRSSDQCRNPTQTLVS